MANSLAPFAVTGGAAGGVWNVHVRGDLDLASRDSVHSMCLMGGRRGVVVDLADVTFMDCAGYAAFARARLVLAERGTSLELRHATGRPARLLQLVGDDHLWSALAAQPLESRAG
jgi:anti-anti-sigma factor